MNGKVEVTQSTFDSLVSAAIYHAMTPEAREAIVTEAISNMLNYGGSYGNTIKATFNRVAVEVVSEIAREELLKNAQFMGRMRAEIISTLGSVMEQNASFKSILNEAFTRAFLAWRNDLLDE